MTTNKFDQVRRIKEYAKEEKVPIMQDEGIEYLTTFIIKHKIKKVLEIGTAIGYSAIKMALSSPNVKIFSIEKDEARYMMAVKNVKALGLEDRITLIFHDALDFNLNEYDFDLIFIDAAKGQNIKFFEKYEKHLTKDGYIITDNMNLHGFVTMEEHEIKSKNLRSLIRKIKGYAQFLEEHEKYKTTFLNVGDGIAVTTSKENG